MRDLIEVDRYRDGPAGDDGAAYLVPSQIDGAAMRVIASYGLGWDHVSVSRRNRCPNWEEMEHVKRLFFYPNELAMQLHVPVGEHISCHPYTLHIWRPNDGREIPTPPPKMVAPPEMTMEQAVQMAKAFRNAGRPTPGA